PLNVEEDQDRLFKRQRQDDELDEELTSSSPLQDSYMKDPEYFDSLVDNVDLSNIGREEEPMPARLRPSTISYWEVLDLTGQHKPTKKKFTSKWKELLNNFQLDIAWKMSLPLFRFIDYKKLFIE
ncbi:21226_t:CDS:2, partial [Entrophospora sp. SA101]